MNEHIQLKTLKNIHFVGIGGIGISAVARMMHSTGKNVTGTNDSMSPDTLDGLRRSGVPITVETASLEHIPHDTELIVYSVAWNGNFPEFMEKIHSLGKPVCTYHQFLGLVSRDFYTIAIAGAHGKTTTTAMTADVCATLKPYAIVGSLLSTGSNYVQGESTYLIVEADDYARGFLSLSPTILVITTIDTEHMDTYKDLADIQSTFRELAQKVPKNGYVIYDASDPRVAPVVEGLACTLMDVSKEATDYTLSVIGNFNKQNAQKALAVGHVLGIDREEAVRAVENFKGTWRRQEYKGTTPLGARVYTDYAHHPTEVRAVTSAFKEAYPEKKLLTVFQPHMFSRTKLLFNDFVTAFDSTDELIITPIYSAREPEDPSISGTMLSNALMKRGINVRTFSTRADILTYIDEHASADTVVLIVTAGDLYTITDTLITN